MLARLGQAAAVAAGLVLIVIAWMVGSALLARPAQPATDVVAIPPTGEVAPARLTNGRPVFVVHHENGQISVLDAFSTHIPYGIHKVVAWCPQSRVFTDLAHGARYDEWGARQGGPAPIGMLALNWQRGAGGLIRVGDRLGPVGVADGSQGKPVDFSACTYVMHDFGADPRLTPAQAIGRPNGSWVVLAGAVDPQGHRVCDLDAGCSSSAAIRGLVVEPSLTGLALEFLTTPRLWLAQVLDGHLEYLTYIPDPDAS